MSNKVYANTNVLANIVSVTAGVMKEVCGGEALADLSSFENKDLLPAMIAANLQAQLTPLLASSKNNNVAE